MTIKEAIKKAVIKLKMKEISSPQRKAILLMQYILNQTRQYIIVYDEKKLTKEQQQKYEKVIEKLLKGMPLQYITHFQEFMKMEFYVNEDVLIPRADTECLVEEVIYIAKKKNAKKILDLCTGSGAIAVALAKYIENIQIMATDISNKAINIAKRNAKNNGVDKKIIFYKSDLFESIPKQKYDIIVSNPPYIKTTVIKTLDKQVQMEPKIALDGGDDGLDFYRKIICTSYNFLKSEGYLCLEIGYDQKKDVEKLIEEEKKFINTYTKKDLYGNDRVIVTNSLLFNL